MDEGKAALKILQVLKDQRGIFLNLRDLARRAEFKGAHVKDFKRGFKLLEKQGIVRLYHSGWASEGFHRAGVVLLADVYVVEDLEKELKGEEIDFEKFTPQAEIQDFTLVAVRTPCGEIGYISRVAYEREKNYSGNFWTHRVRKIPKTVKEA